MSDEHATDAFRYMHPDNRLKAQIAENNRNLSKLGEITAAWVNEAQEVEVFTDHVKIQTLRVAVRFLLAIVKEQGAQDTLIRSAIDQAKHALEISGGLKP